MKQTGKETPEKKMYLRKTRLQGFRTILDTEIEFEPDINIIIGKNGVGKSNFLKFLQSSVIFTLNALAHPHAQLEFSRNGKDTLSIEIDKKVETIIENGTPAVKTTPISFGIYKGGSLKQQAKRAEEVYDFLDRTGLSFSTVFIGHGIPDDYYLVDKPISFKIDRKGFIENYSELISDTMQSYFLKGMIHFIFIKSITLFMKEKAPNRKHLEVILSGAFKLLEPIKRILEKFTDINGLRVNKNYNIVFERNRKEFSVNNLFLEFNVDRQWLPFSHLSDGARRLFYIVSEISFPGFFQYQRTRLAMNLEETNKIVLIEEPELGLHPHQLDSLMHFLQESSEEHQIIVTTHAPQLLDILGKEELNKIIIARLSKNGTKLRHLTKKEKEKAKLYMEEDAYLSDYWRYSDLES